MAYRNDEVIGLVGASTKIVTVTPTLDTNAYASGDRLGTLQTLTGALRQVKAANTNNTALLQSITIIDKAVQSIEMDILFFNASPTIASADNAAFDITDAELGKCIGWVNVAATDYKTVKSGGNSVACVKNVGLVLTATSGTDIYAIPIIRGAPTYAASDLVFQYGILQD